MAWKTLAKEGNFVTWKPVVGDILEGIYTEKKDGVGPRHNSTVYTVTREDGTEVSVWGSAVLDAKFAECQFGWQVRIEYLGKVEKGATFYHNYKFEANDTPEIKVAKKSKKEDTEEVMPF